MKETKSGNDSKRLKRPRIQRATVPGESEKVDIQYNVNLAKDENVKPARVATKLVYSVHLTKT